MTMKEKKKKKIICISSNIKYLFTKNDYLKKNKKKIRYICYAKKI